MYNSYVVIQRCYNFDLICCIIFYNIVLMFYFELIVLKM